MTSEASEKRRWSRQQIRAARQVNLVPLLQHRGLELRDRPADNYEVRRYPGLIVKHNFWRWAQENMAGNTIDFFTHVIGMPFTQAMQEIDELYRL